MTADFVGDENLYPVNSRCYEPSTIPMKLCVPLFGSPEGHTADNVALNLQQTYAVTDFTLRA